MTGGAQRSPRRAGGDPRALQTPSGPWGSTRSPAGPERLLWESRELRPPPNPGSPTQPSSSSPCQHLSPRTNTAGAGSAVSRLCGTFPAWSRAQLRPRGPGVSPRPAAVQPSRAGPSGPGLHCREALSVLPQRPRLRELLHTELRRLRRGGSRGGEPSLRPRCGGARAETPSNVEKRGKVLLPRARDALGAPGMEGVTAGPGGSAPIAPRSPSRCRLRCGAVPIACSCHRGKLFFDKTNKSSLLF